MTAPVNGPQDRPDLLVYIAESRHAAKSPDATERLGTLLLATLLLTDGRGEVPALASRELADAFGAPDEHGLPNQAIFQDTHTRIAEERARIAEEMESQRKAHAAELERERRGAGAVAEAGTGTQCRVGRQPRRVAIGNPQDMLLAVGEVLQTVAKQQGGY